MSNQFDTDSAKQGYDSLNKAECAAKKTKDTAKDVKDTAKRTKDSIKRLNQRLNPGKTAGRTAKAAGKTAKATAKTAGKIAKASAKIAQATAKVASAAIEALAAMGPILIVVLIVLSFITLIWWASEKHWLNGSSAERYVEANYGPEHAYAAEDKEVVFNFLDRYIYKDGKIDYKTLTELSEENGADYSTPLAYDKSPYERGYVNSCQVIQSAFSYYLRDAELRLNDYIKKHDYLMEEETWDTFKECAQIYGKNLLNVNYREILAISTMNEEWDFEHYDHRKWVEKWSDPESVKYLYRETVKEQWQRHVKKSDGSYEWRDISYIPSDKYDDEYRCYGIVNIYPYTQEEICQLFGVDGYAYHHKFTSHTNYECVDMSLNISDRFVGDAILGSSARSPVSDEPFLSSCINLHYDTDFDFFMGSVIDEMTYPDDYIVSDEEVLLEPIIRCYQGNYAHVLLGKQTTDVTVARAGCYVTSLCMVGTYLSGFDWSEPYDKYSDFVQYVAAQNIFNKSGSLLNLSPYNRVMGISETRRSSSISISQMKDYLREEEKPLIIQCGPPIASRTSHFLVINGYKDNEKFFYVCDPANKRTKLTYDEVTKYGISWRTYTSNLTKSLIKGVEGTSWDLPDPGEDVLVREINTGETKRVTRIAKDAYSMEMTYGMTKKKSSIISSRIDSILYKYGSNKGAHDQLLTVEINGKTHYICALVDGMYKQGYSYEASLSNGEVINVIPVDAKSLHDTNGADTQVNTSYGHGYLTGNNSVQLCVLEFFDASNDLTKSHSSAVNYSNQPNLNSTYVKSIKMIGRVS